jgi:hypothetical protein
MLLLTTASDYIRFIRHVLLRRGLTDEINEQWFTPRVNKRQGDDAEDLLSENPLNDKVAWGLGWGLEPAERSFSHCGNNPGFRAFVLDNRDSQDAVVWFAKSARGLRLVRTVLPKTVPGEHPSVQRLGIGHL